MIITKITRQECRDFLVRLGFGRLACAHNGQPYVVPLYFAYKADRLYGFATMGQKIEWMRLNPLVCVEADEVRSSDEWTSIVARGQYEEIPDTPKHVKVRQQAQSLLARRSLWWRGGFAASQIREPRKPDVPVLFSIRIKEITGYRASPDPAPVCIG